MSRDTQAGARQAQLEVYRRMGPARRVEIAVQMSEDARAIARQGIRSRHPDYTPEQLDAAFARLVLGDDLFRRAYPALPVLEP